MTEVRLFYCSHCQKTLKDGSTKWNTYPRPIRFCDGCGRWVSEHITTTKSYKQTKLNFNQELDVRRNYEKYGL